VCFINEERDTEVLEFGLVLEFVEYPGELLLGRDNDRLAILQEPREILGFAREPNDVFEVREVLNIILDVRIEGFAVGEDEHLIH
jgi:hypothetical protein